MGRDGRAGGTPALRLLAARGVEHAVHAYDPAGHDGGAGHGGVPGHGGAAVAALRAAGVDVDGRRVLKTLLVDVDGRLVAALVPVAAQLDPKALALVVGGRRAVLADPARAQRSSGSVVGGISPLAQRTPLPTVVDASAAAFATVLVSAGRRGLQVELAPGDLVALTGAVLAPVAR